MHLLLLSVLLRAVAAASIDMPPSGELSVTFYRKMVTAAEYPLTACGESQADWRYTTFALGALSENFFGAKDGEGPGPGCGLCLTLTPFRDIDGTTMSALKKANLTSIKTKIADLCPYHGGAPSDTGGDNKYWCVATKTDRNSVGSAAHIDMMYESLPEAWKKAVDHPTDPQNYRGNLMVKYAITTCNGVVELELQCPANSFRIGGASTCTPCPR